MYDAAIGLFIEDEIVIEQFDKQPLSPGEIFEPGKYIEVSGVEILYNGKSFLVTNNRTDYVRISCSIVGVKKDGTYDTIQIPSFVGIDETLYEREKSENGWAIKKSTNLVRPNETLDATLDIFDFNDANSDYLKNDIDEDRYLDIMFSISPQPDETTLIFSTNDPKSEIYKIKE